MIGRSPMSSRVESEVAQRVADSLRATLTGVEKATLATKPTENAAAYDAYLRGLAVVASNRESIEAFTSAADFFDTAVRLDPKFALAWARASIAHSSHVLARLRPQPGSREKAKQAAEKARELQPDAGETFLARGYYEYMRRPGLRCGVIRFQGSVLRLPNNADALLSLSLIERRKGRWAGGSRAPGTGGAARSAKCAGAVPARRHLLRPETVYGRAYDRRPAPRPRAGKSAGPRRTRAARPR